MKILVFDVPATSGGALTILNEYHLRAKNDSSNSWFFIIGQANLIEYDNVKTKKYPWVKKNWVYRLFFDWIISPIIAKKIKPDLIISLQNVTIPFTNVRQQLYLHQPLPFTKHRFKFFINPKFWIYQNIISILIIRSIKRAESVIIQTKWMKDACIELTKCNADKFIIKPPEIQLPENKYYPDKNQLMFFYPASGLFYKNHIIVIESIIGIPEQYKKFRVVFTLVGNENASIKKLYRKCQKLKLPVDFIGMIKRDEVLNYYTKSILLFPSYIETFGLPLLEARVTNCQIIAADTEFSREILDNYGKVDFFPYNNSTILMEIMLKYIK